MEINRKRVTEDLTFVWIPTGHFMGEPSGMTGFWEGRDDDGRNLVTFPEGTVRVDRWATFYEPTEAEIEEAIARRKPAGEGEFDVLTRAGL